MRFNPCFIIPVYNHGSTMDQTLHELAGMNMACFVVDDGSNDDTRQALATLAQRYRFVTLITLPVNRGKGAAVICGIIKARRSGYTHALQVDADGQHNLKDVSLLLSMARKNPGALISGCPQYDSSIPKARLYGRYITHFWVWVETLSLSIKDAMCGFRVYPLEETGQVLARNKVGLRMDFDIDIMVRLYWWGTPVLYIPTHVVYPPSGVSHFAVLADNARISWMHTRLVCGMLLRLPGLLLSKFTRAQIKL